MIEETGSSGNGVTSQLLTPLAGKEVNWHTSPSETNAGHTKTIVVCNEKEPRLCGDIRVMPWRMFLDKLWEEI